MWRTRDARQFEVSKVRRALPWIKEIDANRGLARSTERRCRAAEFAHSVQRYLEDDAVIAACSADSHDAQRAQVGRQYTREDEQ